MSRALVPAFLTILLLACRAPESAPVGRVPAGPYVLVLGTAQDGGLPQIGCREERCVAAREDPARRRLVTSLLVCDPRSGQRWLVDCTPDLGAQVELARGHPASRVESGPRPPLFDGIFLTHAHVGHYAGLMELGREVYGARRVPVWGTERMNGFLRTSGPWSLLVEGGSVELHEIVPGESVTLAPDLSIVAFPVPHRDEFSDTVGFEIRGPRRKLVYLPDVDKWEALEALERSTGRAGPGIEGHLARCDVALLDGSFFSEDEVPGRNMADIPHPLVKESLTRFGMLPRVERAKVWFTHLNHTNPAADRGSAARKAIEVQGMHVAAEGAVFGI